MNEGTYAGDLPEAKRHCPMTSSLPYHVLVFDGKRAPTQKCPASIYPNLTMLDHCIRMTRMLEFPSLQFLAAKMIARTVLYATNMKPTNATAVMEFCDSKEVSQVLGTYLAWACADTSEVLISKKPDVMLGITIVPTATGCLRANKEGSLRWNSTYLPEDGGILDLVTDHQWYIMYPIKHGIDFVPDGYNRLQPVEEVMASTGMGRLVHAVTNPAPIDIDRPMSTREYENLLELRFKEGDPTVPNLLDSPPVLCAPRRRPFPPFVIGTDAGERIDAPKMARTILNVVFRNRPTYVRANVIERCCFGIITRTPESERAVIMSCAVYWLWMEGYVCIEGNPMCIELIRGYSVGYAEREASWANESAICLTNIVYRRLMAPKLLDMISRTILIFPYLTNPEGPVIPIEMIYNKSPEIPRQIWIRGLHTYMLQGLTFPNLKFSIQFEQGKIVGCNMSRE